LSTLLNFSYFSYNTTMKPVKTIFTCSKCGSQYPKWAGRCSDCGAWGTISETMTETITMTENVKIDKNLLVDFNNFKADSSVVMSTNLTELDRVLGQGIVAGSLILLGGEPGIGKSTLVLQIANQINNVLYASGEESASQIKSRIERLKINKDNIKFLSENNVEKICAFIIELKPQLVIIDSIQTLYSTEAPSESGSVAQVRICTVRLLEVAKKHNVAIIIIGHITKDGQVAGPKSMEHLVDTVLYLESSNNGQYRILRSVKNRFGSTNEIGIFEMTADGLKEITNPSELFLPENQISIAGSALTCVMEGTRPFLIEIQSLVSKTLFGYPLRKAAGFDLNRLQMLIAVLTKRANLPLLNQDVHLNITGGLKVAESGIDLAACLSIISSLYNQPIPRDTLIIGEVGLGGEIRPVSQVDRRIKEAEKLNFKRIIAPQTKNLKSQLDLVMITDINQAIKLLFSQI